MLCSEDIPSVTPQNTNQAPLSEQGKRILTLASLGIIPRATLPKIPQLKAIFSQETTSTPIFQTQTQAEQLSEAHKGDSLASEPVVSHIEATKITSFEEPQSETLTMVNRAAPPAIFNLRRPLFLLWTFR